MDDKNYNSQPQPSAPETPPPVSPNEAPYTPPVVSPLPNQLPQKKRKGMLIGIIIAVVLLVLAGAGAFAYMWYQNPDKVVTDSIVNAIKAKSMTYTGSMTMMGDTKIKVELTGQGDASTSEMNAKFTYTADGKDYTFDASGRFDKNSDLYVKVKNIDSVVEAYRETLPPKSAETFDKLIAKINDQWIKISAKDLAGYSEEISKQQECVSEAIKKYQSDDAAMKEVAGVYEKNRFIKIEQELASKDGSLGYNLTGDKTAAESFMQGLKNTKIYKSLHDCDPTFTIDEKEQSQGITKDDTHDTRLELWVDRWSHQITKIDLKSKEKDTENEIAMIFQPTFNTKVDIATPDKSITLKQLQADIEELLMSGMTMEEELTAEEAALLSIPELSSEL